MNGFKCKVTGGSKTSKLKADPVAARFCRGNANRCVNSPVSRPLYWANFNNEEIGYDGNYDRKPAYNMDWGFKDGAQDIFESSSDDTTPKPSPDKPSLKPMPTPGKGVRPTTSETTSIVSTKPRGGTRPTPIQPGPPDDGESGSTIEVTVTIPTTVSIYVTKTTYLNRLGAAPAEPTDGSSASSCVWTGHCIGDPCGKHEDCDGDYPCLNGKCVSKEQYDGANMRIRKRRQ
ncbi:hypothetical protein BJ508DRAFT_161074 [Ascobolus immersus RN42]|uniref:Uncharacterized protein n=1 Tax=Ascobolus immersus RN42 TaxID=1160509 RepID=A0A3N4HYB8_ASCIM|nr:hypothetical protein BJ508DRAFT_161074 [Ascobolus immersus RN42]